MELTYNIKALTNAFVSTQADIKEASGKLGIDRRTIQRVLKGKAVKKATTKKIIHSLIRQKEWGIINSKKLTDSEKKDIDIAKVMVGSKNIIDADKLIEIDHELFLRLIEGMYTSRASIIEEFGRRGTRLLNLLIELGIASEDKAGQLKFELDDVSFNIKTDKKLAQKLLDENYKPENFGLSNNWLTNQTVLCDKSVLGPLIVRILREANQKIREVIREHRALNNNKKDVVFITMCSDTVTKEVLQ